MKHPLFYVSIGKYNTLIWPDKFKRTKSAETIVFGWAIEVAFSEYNVIHNPTSIIPIAIDIKYVFFFCFNCLNASTICTIVVVYIFR